jgi:hypothetical protein
MGCQCMYLARRVVGWVELRVDVTVQLCKGLPVVKCMRRTLHTVQLCRCALERSNMCVTVGRHA